MHWSTLGHTSINLAAPSVKWLAYYCKSKAISLCPRFNVTKGKIYFHFGLITFRVSAFIFLYYDQITIMLRSHIVGNDIRVIKVDR